jgi:hypothetical protein
VENIFTVYNHPLDVTQVFIREQLSSKKYQTRFVIDKRDFDSEQDFKEFVEYTVNALNEKFNKGVM